MMLNWKFVSSQRWSIYIFILMWSRNCITGANDLLSDDFFSNNPNKEPIPVVVQTNKMKVDRYVESGQPCLSISYSHRRSSENHTRMEKVKNQVTDKTSRFELLEEFVERRCPPEEGVCPKDNEVRVTFSRPEQKQGFRLVGDTDGDVFPCYPLSDADLRRSRSAVPGNTRRLLQVAMRARAGLTVNVVVIGGSVSHGGACKSYMFEEADHKDAGPCSWANRFVIWMRQRYRNPNIHLISLAQPATTTTWILTHFDRVLKRNPDLLLVEYGVNDAIVSSTDSGRLQYNTMMRAATELLIRKFLQHNEVMKTENAILYVVLQRSFDERSYSYPGEVYYPVCKHYGVPVISVRDAIWPEQHIKREELWVTKSGAHPIWVGHQLITDILAYSWTVAEGSHESTEPTPPVTGSKLKFGASSLSSGDACFNKKMSAPIELQPVREPGNGWTWVAGSKQGWEYNLHHESGISVEWAAGTHEHELAGRRSLRAGLVRKKSKRVARAYGLMQGMDSSVLMDMQLDLKGSDDWIPKDEYVPLDPLEDGEDGEEEGDEDEDDELENSDFTKKNIAPKKRDGKSMMGIRRKNKKKKQVEQMEAAMSQEEDRQYIIEHSEDLGMDSTVEKLWSPTPAPFITTLAPTSQLETALPGIISFSLNFTNASSPTLLLEYVRSWTGYGQAVVWITRKLDHSSERVNEVLDLQARHMLKLVIANSLYVEKCKNMLFDDRSKLRFSPSCSHIRAGTWLDPTVVDGHWDDHSTQIVSTFRLGGLRLEKDSYLASSPRHALIDPSLSLFLGIGMPSEVSETEKAVQGEVHVMMVPWSHKRDLHQTKFKVSALYSC